MTHVKWYPKDSAGRLVTTRVPTITDEATVAQARILLENQAADFDTVNYIYLINKRKGLTGVVSMRQLLQSGSDVLLRELAPSTVVSVRPHADGERVVHVALRANLKAVPVIDAHHGFIGVVPSATILQTLNREHTEDVFRFAGVSRLRDPENHLLTDGPLAHVFARLPWLLLGLVGGIVAAWIVSGFEEALRAQIILAAFIPVVIYLADAVASQTQMLFIRTMTISPDLDIKKYVARECLVNLTLGVSLAVFIFFATWVWLSTIVISTILAATIFLTVALIMPAAIGLPWLFKYLGFDPAVASEPVTTVVCDIIGLCIYFSVASLLLL